MMKKEDNTRWFWNEFDDIIIAVLDAEGGNRTHKAVRPHDFESCASASSATSATIASIS